VVSKHLRLNEKKDIKNIISIDVKIN